MHFTLQPWQFYIVILVGWVSREQQKVIDFYRLQVEARAVKILKRLKSSLAIWV
jgi:hypothetical protein